MADNVELNAGTGGAIAATDDVAGVHYQRVKLVDGTLGGTDAIAGDATNGLDVDVTRIIPGTTATALGKAEDVAHASGDVGVLMLAVRRDTAAVGSGTDGDNSTLNVDASGHLYVNGSGVTQPVSDAGGSLTVDGTVAVSGTVTVASHAVTNAGTFVTQVDGAALTSLQLIDNLVLAEDAAHGSGDPGLMAFAVRRDADTSLVGTDGDYAPLQVNAAGSLKVAITAGAGSGGTSIADGAAFTRDTTSITPVGAVVETSAPTLTNGDAAGLSMTTAGALRVAVASGGIAGIAEDSAAAGGEDGVMVLAVRRDTAASSSGTDGDFSTLNVNATGRLYTSTTVDAALPAGTNNIGDVDVLTLPAIPAGNNNIGDVDIASIAAGDNNIGNVDVVTLPALPAGTNNIGDVDVLTLPGAAHDAAISGNPVRIAGRAMTADYTSVASGDTADLLCTLNGKQVIQPYAIPENTWSYAAASGGIVNTTGVTAKAAAAAGIRNYITHVDVVNGHATVSTDVQIRDGAAGTVLWRGFAQAAGGGVSATFDPPLKGTAATLVEVACGTTGTATYFNLTGYIGP
jgi:hypothetical protein